jgi:hypothetical protein
LAVTFLANSLLILYLPLWQIWLLTGVVKPDDHIIHFEKLTMMEYETSSPINDISNNKITFVGLVDQETQTKSKTTNSSTKMEESAPNKVQYTHYDVIKVALMIAPVWLASNCLYNYSLLLTSVSSSTIIRYNFFFFEFLIFLKIFLNIFFLITVVAVHKK